MDICRMSDNTTTFDHNVIYECACRGARKEGRKEGRSGSAFCVAALPSLEAQDTWFIEKDRKAELTGYAVNQSKVVVV